MFRIVQYVQIQDWELGNSCPAHYLSYDKAEAWHAGRNRGSLTTAQPSSCNITRRISQKQLELYMRGSFRKRKEGNSARASGYIRHGIHRFQWITRGDIGASINTLLLVWQKYMYTCRQHIYLKFFSLFTMITKIQHQTIAYLGCLNGSHHQIFPFLAPFDLRHTKSTSFCSRPQDAANNLQKQPVESIFKPH